MTTPTLNQAAAEAVDRIATSVMSAGWDTFELMRESGGWQHLGFDSFEAWASSQSKPQLTRAERKELVADLDAKGMTQREIAATVGVDQKTVSNDLRPKPEEYSSNEAPVHAQEAVTPEENASAETVEEAAARLNQATLHATRLAQLGTIIVGVVEGMKVFCEFTPEEIAGVITPARRKVTGKNITKWANKVAAIAAAVEAKGTR